MIPVTHPAGCSQRARSRRAGDAEHTQHQKVGRGRHRHMVKQGTHPKRKLRGKESLPTVLCCIAHPTCTADQMITFTFKCTDKIYKRKNNVTDGEKELGLSEPGRRALPWHSKR